MKRTWKAFLAAIPIILLAGPAYAQCGCGFSCGPNKTTCDVGCHFNFKFGGCGCCLAGPWYSYWPYEAHFQTPAPVGCFPYWPGPAAGQPVPTGAAVPALTSPTAVQPSSYQPVGYFTEAPAYWYRR
jgi:hypothetical protein